MSEQVFIAPVIGRNVWYRPGPHDHAGGMQIFREDQPLDAHVVFVWSDTEVNLVVFDHNGGVHRRTRVPINCGDHIFPRAEWMPFQKGQAKKEDNLEEVRRLASAGKPLI